MGNNESRMTFHDRIRILAAVQTLSMCNQHNVPSINAVTPAIAQRVLTEYGFAVPLDARPVPAASLSCDAALAWLSSFVPVNSIEA